jgi:hypothetical protein
MVTNVRLKVYDRRHPMHATANKGPFRQPYSSVPNHEYLVSNPQSPKTVGLQHALHADMLGMYKKIVPTIGCIGLRPEDTYELLYTSHMHHSMLPELDVKEICC